jgi:glucose-1-phosphate cytidylyltransferase
MKVVLFCGGQGTRLRDYSETIPKPMVPIGYRPILWNIMKYYAHFGYKDFILALGYKADYIKNYFINYDERVSNDFVMSWGGKKVDMLSTDIEDWRITFVDTGFSSNVGMRLMRVRKYLEGEEMFMANYADGLSDMYLPDHVDNFLQNPDKVGALVTYPAAGSNFHTLRANDKNEVLDISPISVSGFRLNTGYFIFRKEVFDYINYGEDLNDEPLHRMIDDRKLIAYRHDGFWKAMDTFKDKMELDNLYKKGDAPWEVWKEEFDPSQYEFDRQKASFETQNS